MENIYSYIFFYGVKRLANTVQEKCSGESKGCITNTKESTINVLNSEEARSNLAHGTCDDLTSALETIDAELQP